ncbi:LysM peptidoglycan-binding domain-containing protein [Pararoseomonas sp. SCSIO 73927]|uniref:DUF6973 domain-containing protein n=1 Tax=Pararoseomonas sp. SCSIO 73927 TaxID=3114537 RepID=UPI0030D48578
MAPLDAARPPSSSGGSSGASPSSSASVSDAPAKSFDTAVAREKALPPAPPPLTGESRGASTQTGTPKGASETDVASAGASEVTKPAPAATGAADGASGTVRNALDTGASIDKLNSDGDRAVVQLTGEANLSLPTPWKFNATGKAQYGFEATVTQVGDAPANPGDKPPQYEVTFGKNVQGGLGAELRLGGAGKFGGELNLGSADRVTMRFDTKEEAARAVDSLERMAAAETIRDTASVIPGPVQIPGASGLPRNPAGNPLNGASDTPVETPGADRPGPSEAGNGPGGYLNPNNLPEIVGEAAARQVEPNAADQAFLRDHIVSYEQQLTVQERVKLEGKLSDNLALEGRFDANQSVIRTVELPPGDGGPGRLSYAIEGANELTTKEKLDFKKNILNPALQDPKVGSFGYNANNVRDVFDSSGRVTLSWDIPADQFQGNGQPLPEADLLSSGGWAHPDEISVRTQANVMAQSPLDASRTDQIQLQAEATLKNPDQHAARILEGLAHGNLGDALSQVPADTTVSTRAQFVARDGTQTQHQVGVELKGIGEAKASLIANVGNDDVQVRSDRSWTGAQPPAEAQPGDPAAPVEPGSPPQGRPDQLVVVPRDGLNIRPSPDTSGAPTGVFQHGSFLQPTGQQATDAAGGTWVEVRGTDAADKPVQGWVAQEHTATHPDGAMDSTGRINPELEKAGFREVTVQPGDTIWDIAKREGTGFEDTVALNRDHIIQPDLIFPGDTVYLPGTAAPPAPAAQPAPEPAPEPAPQGGSGNGPSGGTSQGGTSQGGASPPSGGNPSAPPAGPSGGSSQPYPGASDGSSGTPPTGGPTAPETPAPDTTAPTTPAPDTSGRPDLGAVLRDNQVQADPGGMVEYAPVGGLFGSRTMTATEADMLGGLFPPWKQNDVKGIAERASETAAGAFPDNPVPSDVPSGRANEWQGNDGHRDAMRHALGAALLTKEFGADWAGRFTTAHEGLPEEDQNADREAMDLYNNGVGIRIAEENPDASEEELAGLIQEAIGRGEMVVIGPDHELAWSDGVPVGGHNLADDPGVPGVRTVPNGASE